MKISLKIILGFALLASFVLCVQQANGQSRRAKDTSGYFVKDSIVRKGYTLIFINKDSTINPALKSDLVETFYKVYPQLAKRFNKKTSKRVTFVIDPSYDGVAATSGGRVVYSSAWFRKNPRDIDVVTHEVMHIVQSYGGNNVPGWVVEGIADYVRYKYGVDNAGAGWTLPAVKPTQKYTDAYRVTARFFAWIEATKSKKVINKVDAAARNNTYTEDIWKKYTGNTIDELWAEYINAPFNP